MAINYVKKDGGMYDQRLVQGLVTGDLETRGVDFIMGAKSFTVTNIKTSGYKPHDRNTKGFNQGSVENKKTVYTMTQDRDIEFYVDVMDVDETNRDLEAARISNVFITENAAPEIDAYRFQVMSKKAVEAKQSAEEALTAENVYSKLKAAILPIRKYGAGNLIAYLSSETMDLLERSKEFTRNITNQNVGTSTLDSRVTSLDGVMLREVWDTDRFNTQFDFSDGFKATGKGINFLVVARPSIIAAVKHQAIYLFAPGEVGQGDGWMYQNRLYHDLFVLEERKDGLFVSTKTAGA